MADLVDAVPGDLLHVQRVGVQDLVGLLDDDLERRVLDLAVVALGDRAQVDVHPAEVTALARDVQDVARLGVDRALGAPVREVGVDQYVHHAPGVRGHGADVLAADRLAHPAAGAVAARDVLGADGALLALAGTGGVLHAHLDGVLPLVLDREAHELDAVVGDDAGGAVSGGLGEVVQHARLVHDQVRELADLQPVVLGARGADDVLTVLGVGAPEVHPTDVVRLGDDPLGEPEGLEGLDAAGLDAVGLTELQSAGTALDDARAHSRELRHLGGQQHARGTGADDEHVHLVGEIRRAIDAQSFGGEHAGLAGHVAVVVELHRRVLPWTASSGLARRERVFYIRTHRSTIEQIVYDKRMP